jgi:hypothetical protein
MFDPRIELLLKHHPASIFCRQPTGYEQFEQLERRKPRRTDVEPLTEFDEQSRTILDIFGLGFAVLALFCLFALVATVEVRPPSPAIVAYVPPGER